MELMIITKDDKTKSRFAQYADQLIVQDKLRNVDVILEKSEVSFEVNAKQRYRLLFFLIDTRDQVDVQIQWNRIRQQFPYCSLGIISQSYQQAIHAVNRLGDVQACIVMEERGWMEQLRLLLHRLNQKELMVNQAIVWRQQGIDRIIPFEEIDFIETVKGEHYCMVHYGDKQIKIRSSIRRLNVLLDERFVQIRSSLIINARKIDTLNGKEREILLHNGSVCYFTEGYKEALMNWILMQRER